MVVAQTWHRKRADPSVVTSRVQSGTFLPPSSASLSSTLTLGFLVKWGFITIA